MVQADPQQVAWLSALIAAGHADAEPHLIVEALASPARWRPEAIVRTPDGYRLAIATNR